MHYPILIIVEADDRGDALAQAEYTAENLVESGNFDYYDLDGLWGKSEAHELDSKEGKQLVAEGMASTRTEFDDAIKHVRYIIEHYTDDQIYSGKFERREGENLPDGIHYLSRWQLGRASGGIHQCYVYGSGVIWRGPMENDRELEEATEGKDNLWVVLIDFHN